MSVHWFFYFDFTADGSDDDERDRYQFINRTRFAFEKIRISVAKMRSDKFKVVQTGLDEFKEVESTQIFFISSVTRFGEL